MAKQMTETRLVKLVKQAAGYEDIEHKKTKSLIMELYDKMFVIEPVGDDECRSLWIRVPEAKPKWHKLTTSLHFGHPSITLGNTLLFVIRERCK